MVRRSLVLTVLVFLAITLFLRARARYPGKAPVKLAAESCDQSLWRHVYDPDRLKVIEPCTAVEGRVVSLSRGADGDLHIALEPDQESVLNLFNAVHGGSHLALEVICEHTATKPSAAAACAAFTSRVAFPAAGQRVRATGSYVTDRDNGWNEIHPVSRIETLP